MDGIYLIDKPKGWTSFDVVAKIRSTLKNEAGKRVKVGHTGTLDPLATGMLVIVVGSYCKRASEFSKLDKMYEVTMKLGEVSSTGDGEGEISVISNDVTAQEDVQKAIMSFIGEIQQTPPAFSAIKVDGKRAYKLAREGKEVKIDPRIVVINSIDDISYEYPLVTFTTSVSSGTYIRSLVEDIGKKLDVGAFMTDLRRTKVGSFDISQSVDIDNFVSAKLLKP